VPINLGRCRTRYKRRLKERFGARIATVDYNDIPVFLRVVETGSFTKAAQWLGVQKSSISRSLSRLESELGVRLLQRTTRQLGLTDAGQTFYERVRGAMHGFEEAAATVRELGSEPRGAIRMTAPPGAAGVGLAAALSAFTRQYPSITVEVVLVGRMVELVSEGFDLALRAGRLSDSSLIAKKVGATDLALMAAPSYLKRSGRPGKVSDLSEHECVLFRGRNGRCSWILRDQDGAEQTVEVTGSISADEIEFVLQAAIAGAGIAALPPQLVREPVVRKQLDGVLRDHHVPGNDLHVILPSSTFVPARVMLLRNHLVEHLSANMAAAYRECTEARAKQGDRPRALPAE
jgi:DNA-binding transcriptional LysR family regulator